MLIRLAFVGLLIIQTSNILAEVPPPQPPRPIQAYPVQPATGAAVAADANAAKLAVLHHKQRECEQLQNEIRQLQSELGTVEQFRVRVQMLEVSLTKLQRLSAELTTAGGTKSSPIQDVEGLRQAIASGGMVPLQQSQLAASGNVHGFVEWLITNNIAKEIASPTLVVSDGRPAKFFSGLEVPVPRSAAPAGPVDSHRVGTEIDLTAFSREDNRVRISIRGSVRELDEAHSIVVNGARIPAMKARQFVTGVEGSVGEPLVLGGLVEKRVESTKSETGPKEEVNEIALIAIIIPDLVGVAAEAKPKVGDAKQQRIRPGDVVTVVFEQECGALQPNNADRPHSKSAKCAPRIAAQVVKVRANGDLEVESRREILADDSILHRQELSGVVHPASIDLESRTVSSSQIAELSVTTHSVATPAAVGKRR